VAGYQSAQEQVAFNGAGDEHGSSPVALLCCVELLSCSPQIKYAIMIAIEAQMAQILVRNIEDPVKARLQRRAKRNGRSMEAELREILRDAARAETAAPEVGFGTASVALFSGRGIGLDEGEEILEWRGFPLEPIKFDE
jgi:plasmid stability protein